MQRKVLEARIYRAGYKGSFIIQNISLSIGAGEILLVTGRSGSGKSTLLKSIAGLIEIDGGFFDGVIAIKGQKISPNPLVLSKSIFYVPQEPWYGIVGYTVQTDYCHTLSIYGKHCKLELLEAYGLLSIANRVVYGISAGESQRLLWAEALETSTLVVLFDEPYTYIDLEGRAVFKKYLEKALSTGRAVVVVDHMPENWEDYEPYMLVLDRGKPSYYGRFRSGVEALDIRSLRRERATSLDVLLEAENVWFSYHGHDPVLRGVDLSLRRREIIGIVGRNGTGKTTLLKVLAGVYNARRGRVRRRGSTVYVPENPLLYFSHPLPREEIFAAVKPSEKALRIVRAFDLEHLLDKPLAKLSSGERRRVALASALVRGYSIYLLDEPTGGLDRYTVESLVEAIAFIAETGSGVIVAHHDPRLTGLFDAEYKLEGGSLQCIY